ncbi:hypothetical protein Aph01nite_52050 [Acrocarpospora phusangensis]|uniref:Lipoprotein n=1 Tax=Acrocarpospora phusangensis TaxID=1070424 RepID=A0A919QGC0_9ACTN|nr:hypothetical protein [Acrocarpospora phusangensis]GIH26895.1 hypothetical protein Aph01nite_52050 [Acrocarpospora phusangensis]
MTVLRQVVSRVCWTVALVGSVPLIAGSLSDGSSSDANATPLAAAHHQHQAKPAAGPATLEELAAKIGCTLSVQGQGKDLRQGSCSGQGNPLTLVTFDTDVNQKDWLTAAEAYGGTYLIGTRWVVVGQPDVIDPLAGKLGGRVENADHGGHS